MTAADAVRAATDRIEQAHAEAVAAEGTRGVHLADRPPGPAPVAETRPYRTAIGHDGLYHVVSVEGFQTLEAASQLATQLSEIRWVASLDGARP